MAENEYTKKIKMCPLMQDLTDMINLNLWNLIFSQMNLSQLMKNCELRSFQAQLWLRGKANEEES